MLEGNTSFITLHYTEKVVYTCQDGILELSTYTTLPRCICMSGGNTLFINLHYTDKVVHTCQEVMLYLSPHA